MRMDKKTPVELRTTQSALLELCQELGISESDTGGKVTFEGNDSYVASKHHLGESTATWITCSSKCFPESPAAMTYRMK